MTNPESAPGHPPSKHASPSRRPTSRERCDHGLPLWKCEEERVCALEYLNRFIAPRKVEKLRRRGSHLYLVFDTGEALECCCESCGESHGDDPAFRRDIEELALGRRALRFRLEGDTGVVVWFARGDHLHLHRNTLLRFRPRARKSRSLRPAHLPELDSREENP